MNIDYFLLKNLLMPVRLPSSWCISKNYLFNFDVNWINGLNNSDKFKISEVYLYDDVYMSQSNIGNYLSSVYAPVYPEIIDGKYNNINYKICIQICNKNKKLLKYFEYPISDVFNLVKAIEIISLDIYYYIGEGDMEKVFFNLNNFLKDTL